MSNASGWKPEMGESGGTAADSAVDFTDADIDRMIGIAMNTQIVTQTAAAR
jgi:hypothetical protein